MKHILLSFAIYVTCRLCRECEASDLVVCVFSVQDTINLCGQVFFPNLQFDKMSVDFGCILNDTEVTRYIHIVNTSPMEVSYQWSFLLNDQSVAVFHEPPNLMESSKIVVEDLDNADAEIHSEDVHLGVEDELIPVVRVDIEVEGLSESPSHEPGTLSEVRARTIDWLPSSLLLTLSVS